MSRKRRPAPPRREAEVVALGDHEAPESAAAFVMEASATGKLAGCILVLVDDEGNVDTHYCGQLKRDEMAWAAGVLNYRAFHE